MAAIARCNPHPVRCGPHARLHGSRLARGLRAPL